MRICHITSAHDPEDVRIFYKECCSLAKHGYDTHLVQMGSSYIKNGVNIHGFGTMEGSRFKRARITTRKAYQVALEVNADIYHIHDPELLPYALKLKRSGKVVIFDSHENNVGYLKEKPYWPKIVGYCVSFFYGIYEKYICKRIDGIIGVTPDLTDYFSKMNKNTETVSNFPVFIEPNKAPSFNNKKIVFAGLIDEQWNHENIIRALEYLPDVKYELCGSGQQEFIEKLKKMPAWDRVEFRGRIPHSEVANVLSDCSIGLALLSPSLNTYGMKGTMGNNKIFEEMMAGLPVICTNFERWEDFVNRYSCGICIDPSNPHEIADAISGVLSNLEKAKEMGENGLEATRVEYNWSTQEQKLIRLYERIAGKISHRVSE